MRPVDLRHPDTASLPDPRPRDPRSHHGSADRRRGSPNGSPQTAREAARPCRQIAQPAEQLIEGERRLERLEIIRATVLEIAEDSNPGGSEPPQSAYRRLESFE